MGGGALEGHAGGGPMNMTTMSGINLDPLHFFNSQAAFNAFVLRVEQKKSNQTFWTMVAGSQNGTVITNVGIGTFVSSDGGTTGLGSLDGLLTPEAKLTSFNGNFGTFDNGEGINGEFKGAVVGRISRLYFNESSKKSSDDIFAADFSIGEEFLDIKSSLGDKLNLKGYYTVKTGGEGVTAKYFNGKLEGFEIKNNQFMSTSISRGGAISPTFTIGDYSFGFGINSAGFLDGSFTLGHSINYTPNFSSTLEISGRPGVNVMLVALLSTFPQSAPAVESILVSQLPR